MKLVRIVLHLEHVHVRDVARAPRQQAVVRWYTQAEAP
jgi:hypothetical protein